MFPIFDSKKDFAPDLEWMLQSGQVDDSTLIQALVEEYYQPVYRLALALLNESSLALKACQQVFVTALINVYRYRSQSGVDRWFYSLALQVFRGYQRRTKARKILSRAWLLKGSLSRTGDQPLAIGQAYGSDASHLLTQQPPADEVQASLRQGVEELSDRLRMIVILRCLLDLPGEVIAHVLKISEAEVDMGFSTAGQKLLDHLAGSGYPARALPEGDLETSVRRAFALWWPLPVFSDAQLGEVITGAIQHARAHGARLKGFTSFKELSLLAVVVLVVAALIWAANFVLPDQAASPTPTPFSDASRPIYAYAKPGDTLEALAERLGISVQDLSRLNGLAVDDTIQVGRQVKVPPPASSEPPARFKRSPQPEPISMRSDSQAIQLLILQSQGLWHTIWADAQVIYYGPSAYIGPARFSRFQVWVSQPDQARQGSSLEISGPLTGAPLFSYLAMNGHRYFSSWRFSATIMDPPWFDTRDEYLRGSPLQDMVFPGRSEWLTRGGSFKAVENGEVSGRRSLVVDWYNADGMREQRLWVDVRNGLVLRQQKYGGEGFATLISDAIFTGLTLDKDFPAAVYRPERALPANFAADESGEPLPQGIPAPTPAVKPVERPALTSEPPPPGFDPSHSYLVFQFPQTLAVEDTLRKNTTVAAELFADGYDLGKLEIGLPWAVSCDRSPDGQRVGFVALSQSITQTQSTFVWFNLIDPGKIYQPLPQLRVRDMAFAPDNRQAAVFGYRRTEDPTGVYLLTLGIGEAKRILDVSSASSLVWSPDGEYLAMIGRTGLSQVSEILVVRVKTGQVTYQREWNFGSQQVPPDSPTRQWGVTFPRPADESLEACALPPPTS